MASNTFEFDVDDDTHANVTVKGDDDTLENDTFDLDDDTIATEVNELPFHEHNSLSAALDAKVVETADGKARIKCKPKPTVWDGSETLSIIKPKSDADMQLRLGSFLELLEYIKKSKPPSGIILDPTKITLSKKDCQLGLEFTKTEQVLGRGIKSGDIVVLKDIATGTEHAQKKMMISYFRTNEVRCWVDLNDTGFVPRIYLFKIEGNQISLHMEFLKDAKTLRCIIDEHWHAFHSSECSRSLLRPFSLFVLDGVMEALSEMHRKGWVHNDLHSGNVMIQKTSEKTLAVKILNFGLANKLNSQDRLDYKGFTADISEVLRMFSALYSGVEYNDRYDIRVNWEKAIHYGIKLEVVEQEELFCLVKGAMALVQPDDVQEYRTLDNADNGHDADSKPEDTADIVARNNVRKLMEQIRGEIAFSGVQPE